MLLSPSVPALPRPPPPVVFPHWRRAAAPAPQHVVAASRPYARGAAEVFVSGLQLCVLIPGGRSRQSVVVRRR
ncbi:hypothetical protein BV20DRAFT_181040 [Pilatotrama ljubarskyi]|nr:hypothetical protein BV20DRAFT_181040 [Pilatotrama ljubarskyi]